MNSQLRLRWIAAAVTMAVTALAVSQAASAQSYGNSDYGYSNNGYSSNGYSSNGYSNGRYGRTRAVRCESIGSRRTYCRADTRGGVRIARQISQRSCIQGRNWSYDSRGIWVSGGCRADFAISSRHGDRRDGYGSNDYGSNGTIRTATAPMATILTIRATRTTTTGTAAIAIPIQDMAITTTTTTPVIRDIISHKG